MKDSRAPKEGTATRFAFLVRALVLLIVVFVIGCGGSGSKSSGAKGGGGRVSLVVKWPSRSGSRVIPLKADSISITLRSVALKKDGQPVLIEHNAQHPPLHRPFGDAGGTSTYTREDIPSGKWNVDVLASPDPPAGESAILQAVAEGHGQIDIRGGETTTITITLGTTVETLEVSAGAASLPVNGTTTLKATPRNDLGQMVMVAPSTVTWMSSDPSVATVDTTGLNPTVHALKKGNVTFTATFGQIEASAGQAPINSPPYELTIISSGHLYRRERVYPPGGDSYELLSRTDLKGDGREILYRLSDKGDIGNPTLSANGSLILIESGVNQEAVLEATTGVVVAQISLQEYTYVFGGTSSHLYRRERVFPPNGNIYDVLVRTDLQGNGRLVLYQSSDIGDPRLSVDGSLLLIEQDANMEALLEAATGNLIARITLPEYTYVFGATLSHVYRRERIYPPGGGSYELLAHTDLQGGGRQVLYQSSGSIGDPRLSADGLLITIQENGFNGVVVLDSMTGAVVARVPLESYTFAFGAIGN